MPKIKYKEWYYSDDEKEKIFEVYGVQVCEEKHRAYDNSWTEEKTYFLIYDNRWQWVDSKYYVPVEE